MNARRAESLVFTGIREAQVKTIDVAAPAAGELRLKTLACGICWREIHVFTGRLERSFPCVMGHEPVGIVDDVGPGVRGFKAGDRVTAIGQASLAEYCLVEDKYTAPISTNGEAANYLGEPVMCALAALRQANPRDGSLVVVNGVGFMGQLLMQALARRTKSQLVAVDINHAALARAAQFTGCETLTPAHSRNAQTTLWSTGRHRFRSERCEGNDFSSDEMRAKRRQAVPLRTPFQRRARSC
jgi:threonine dehydrogenase-like Zn-dependent dehydrogenase